MGRPESVMFNGFVERQVKTSNASIHLRIAGKGPPVLLLHGYPETHAMWHRVAPSLAEHYTVVCTDLRGYGDSSKPEGSDSHVEYSKRELARDQVEVMKVLGFNAFVVVGHDRGGRVAHRMALDHPDVVRKLVVIDICPTKTMYERITKEFATVYYHWFFLIQQCDLPERLIGADPEYFLRSHMGRRREGLSIFSAEAMKEYIRCFVDPKTIHATCEEYRASATIDLEHDAADEGNRIAAPMLVLWGRFGLIGKCFDPVRDWNQRVEQVRGIELNGGHYLPEEKPQQICDIVSSFSK